MNPPSTVALWLLRRSGASEALVGDLIESFHQGRSHAWFWKQVLIVIALGHHAPPLAFALVGTLLPFFLDNQMFPLRNWITWWNLPWPWSQLVFEFSLNWFVPLAASPILIAGLVWQRKFRWIGLVRTLLFAQLLLLTLPYLAALLPASARLRHSPTNPWSVLFVAAWFTVLLASAWLGCRSPRRAVNWKQEHS